MTDQVRNRTEAALTRRELECLWLLAEGEQQKRVGHVLGLAPGTVEEYLASARKKLKARTTTQAVAIAVARGILAAELPAERDWQASQDSL